MNGSKSPDPATQLVDSGDTHDNAPRVTNGHPSPSLNAKNGLVASPVPSIEGDQTESRDATAQDESERRATTNGGDEDAASEAETLIDSPVKKKEAEKQNAVVKMEKPQKSRIGSLPVPGDDDEDGDSTASPMESREMSVGKATSNGDAKDEDLEMMDDGSDKENGSDSLSSVRSSPSNPPSRGSSRSRALSERPQQAGNGTSGSPNPRKRKHRASSVSLPSSKRRSMDPPKRTRLRGMHSEDHVGMERSPSPNARGHRRAVSTQSALDGTAEGSGRKRRAGGTYPGREPKSATKSGWEESDASSETTSRGHDETKRPQRGVVRSTSTPGRPSAREHKRHVNKYGFTRFAEACEDGSLDLVKEWREKDPDALEVAEFAGNRPLQIAALNGNAEVVSYLIDEGCQIDCANGDKDTPLIDAAENGHLQVVRLLLDAGVDPLRQNLKGQQALDVVTDDTDEATHIRGALHKAIDLWNSSEARQRREEEEEQRHRAGPSKELHFMARTYENLLKLVQNNDRNGVREFLAARVPVDNAIIAAAAKTGDLYLVNMLLAEMTEKKANQKPEKPMMSVLGTSHFEMVKALTELDNFNPIWRNRSGKSWPELAEERNGPMWRQERELLQRLYDQRGGSKERRSSSPVTKRDSAKRKFQHLNADDESDGDEERAPKRKNGRRLMSRKDMRAVSGKGALSDSSDEDQDESADEETPAADTGATEEASVEMKPPDTPTTRRRLRSKSNSSHTPESSPKSLRKRSNSFRGAAEKALPTVVEKNEDKDSGSDIMVGEADRVKREREEEAKFAIEEAKRLDEKRKEEEAAEAEAKRAEEEARKAEEQRKAEEERQAEQERDAEEARRKEEEMRMLEQARIAEEERLQKERERVEARKAYAREALDALPSMLRHVLEPDSSFKFEGENERNYLLMHFAPLRVFSNDVNSGPGLEVLNIQAAALLGKDGLQLLFKSDEPGFEHSLADLWTTKELNEYDHRILDQILAHLPYEESVGADDVEMHDPKTSFEDELKRTAKRYNAFIEARRRLRGEDCKVRLRRVRLDDVVRHLHPLLRQSAIATELATSASSKRDTVAKHLEVRGTQPFVQRLRAFCEMSGYSSVDVLEGRVSAQTGVSCASLTDVVVVHEK